MRPLTAPGLADHPRLRHAFFTREGGVSEGLFASLNCGLRNADEAERVQANRARAAEAVGFEPGRLVTARQVHGTAVLVVGDTLPGPLDEEADALVTDRPDVVLGVLTADCVPVLVADPERGVIGAAHAGWRGALGGVVEATIAAMARLGARPPAMAAAIGPCIRQPSYEVGPELGRVFEERHPEARALFAPCPGADRLLFDLAGFVLGRLEAAGIGAIDLLPHDTFADETRFFSSRRAHKRAEPGFGLMLSAIAKAG